MTGFNFTATGRGREPGAQNLSLIFEDGRVATLNLSHMPIVFVGQGREKTRPMDPPKEKEGGVSKTMFLRLSRTLLGRSNQRRVNMFAIGLTEMVAELCGGEERLSVPLRATERAHSTAQPPTWRSEHISESKQEST